MSPFAGQEQHPHAPSGMVAPYEAYQPPDPMFNSPALSSATTTGFLYPGMSPYGPQTMTEMPSPHLGMFYNYSGAGRPGSHFYYTPQPMPFQHLGPPPIPAGGSPVFTKKRIGQVCIQNICAGIYAHRDNRPSSHLPKYLPRLPCSPALIHPLCWLIVDI